GAGRNAGTDHRAAAGGCRQGPARARHGSAPGTARHRSAGERHRALRAVHEGRPRALPHAGQEAKPADQGAIGIGRTSMRTRHGALIGAAFLLAFVAAGPTHAQDYPAKQVTFVLPFAAGGAIDLAARYLAQKLTDRLGKPFVVENKSGAGTVVGS